MPKLIVVTREGDEREIEGEIGLSVMDGLSQSEIAASTGLPLGTVKTLMRRGLLAIRAVLGEGAHP